MYALTYMKGVALLLCALSSTSAIAAKDPHSNRLPPVVPMYQELLAVDYFREGRQSGCGLRITGEAEEDVWLNVLVSVLLEESGQVFGVFKVSAKTMDMKDGAPQLRDGRSTYTSIGKIHDAWLRTRSGLQPDLRRNGRLPHSDGYMASMDSGEAMDLLVALTQAGFRVGITRTENVPEEIYEFNEQISLNEANKLLACMKNLRESVDVNRTGKRSQGKL